MPQLKDLILNKFLIPAALIATVIIAGIFAFMPVEKASTVHGTLATASSLTSTTADEADNQNRAIDFYYNMSHRTGLPGGNNVTIVLGESGKTFTGYATLTAIANVNQTAGTSSVITNRLNCGLQTTGEDGTVNKLGINATGGMTNFTRFSAANGLTANEGIAVVLANKSGIAGAGITGVCAGTIVLTSWGS